MGSTVSAEEHRKLKDAARDLVDEYDELAGVLASLKEGIHGSKYGDVEAEKVFVPGDEFVCGDELHKACDKAYSEVSAWYRGGSSNMLDPVTKKSMYYCALFCAWGIVGEVAYLLPEGNLDVMVNMKMMPEHLELLQQHGSTNPLEAYKSQEMGSLQQAFNHKSTRAGFNFFQDEYVNKVYRHLTEDEILMIHQGQLYPPTGLSKTNEGWARVAIKNNFFSFNKVGMHDLPGLEALDDVIGGILPDDWPEQNSGSQTPPLRALHVCCLAQETLNSFFQRVKKEESADKDAIELLEAFAFFSGTRRLGFVNESFMQAFHDPPRSRSYSSKKKSVLQGQRLLGHRPKTQQLSGQELKEALGAVKAIKSITTSTRTAAGLNEVVVSSQDSTTAADFKGAEVVAPIAPKEAVARRVQRLP